MSDWLRGPFNGPPDNRPNDLLSGHQGKRPAAFQAAPRKLAEAGDDHPQRREDRAMQEARIHDDHGDDRQVGRILSRREAMTLLAAAAVALPACAPSGSGSQATATSPATAAGGAANQPGATAPSTTHGTAGATQVAAPSCIVKPALTEGPYFVDEKLNRSDIRTDPSDGSVTPGTPLTLAFRVARLGAAGCTAFSGATIDVWHCNAAGVYSDVSANNTVGKKFLRGYQTTDAAGNATFTTIYPGWYQGRAVHIHFKIRTPDGKDFTSQLFFDEALTDQVYARAPYSSRTGTRLKNTGDGIFDQGGNQLLLDVVPDGQGYATTFEIGLQA
jgi:protocatechuate 3,4-dioxygenase beta subunit